MRSKLERRKEREGVIVKAEILGLVKDDVFHANEKTGEAAVY